MRLPRRAILLGVLAVAVFALASPAGAGDPGEPRVKLAKHENGPWSAGTSSGGEVLKLNLSSGEAKNLYFRVANTTAETQDATLTEAFAPEKHPFGFRWFKGNTEITAEVQTDGFSFNLKPGSPKVFRARAKLFAPSKAGAKAGPSPDSACLFGSFFVLPEMQVGYGAFSINDPTTSVCAG